jgi:aspartyl-tRNA(Asn)/glutamyl-tRNA(Gln) amidotransferase subunit A
MGLYAYSTVAMATHVPMMVMIPDWTALDDDGRRDRQDSARALAHALNPVLNAFASIEGTAAGNSGGLPYAAKDMFRTPGHRPGGGFGGAVDLGIADDSDVLARLDAAGADRVGFTNMTEFAYEPSGFNATTGRVRNPWNLDVIAGGSSSGSAAAVAGGAVVAALGSDTGGSLRIPAHACGITSWKPTHGAVSVRGTMPLAPSLDTIGLLARSANDMMPLVRTIAALQPSPPVTRAVVVKDVVADCAPAIQNAAAEIIDVIAACGITITQRPGLAAIDAIDRHALIVMQGESARTHRARLDDAAIAPALRRRLAKGLDIDDATLAASVGARAGLVRDFDEQVLAGGEVAILPVMGIPTPDAAECDPTSQRFSARTLYALSRFTRFVNMLGAPAVSLPCGFDGRGLPIGVQIVGRAGCDLALIDLAHRVQARTRWHAHIPSAIAHLVAGHLSIPELSP